VRYHAPGGVAYSVPSGQRYVCALSQLRVLDIGAVGWREGVDLLLDLALENDCINARGAAIRSLIFFSDNQGLHVFSSRVFRALMLEDVSEQIQERLSGT
jgi:hypothetical protein